MTKTIKAAVEMIMEVAEDCVVFAGTCLCHQLAANAETMIKETIAAGMTKIVIVGDCDDHESVHEDELAEIMQAAGMQYVWLWNNCEFINELTSGFSSTAVKQFAAAEDFGKLRDLLDSMGRKVYDVKQQIKFEDWKLREYPIVAKIQSIESHNHSTSHGDFTIGTGAFNTLFFGSVPRTLVSEVNAVMLLNPEKEEGLLVTKSQLLKFTLTRESVDVDALQGRKPGDNYSNGKGGGSLKISFGPGVPEVSVYCEPGVWKIGSHPELQVMDPNVHYEPMWKRVVKA